MHKFEATTATPETVPTVVDTKVLTDAAFHAMEVAMVWDEAAAENEKKNKENNLRNLEVEFGAMDVWCGQDQVPHTD
jgi:hypothetical protein